jgi:hypothetical protein
MQFRKCAALLQWSRVISHVAGMVDLAGIVAPILAAATPLVARLPMKCCSNSPSNSVSAQWGPVPLGLDCDSRACFNLYARKFA